MLVVQSSRQRFAAESPCSQSLAPMRWLWMALLMLSACGEFGEDVGVPALRECSTHGDCLDGLECQARFCVDPAVSVTPIALQLTLSGSASEPPRQVSQLEHVPGEQLPDIIVQPLLGVNVEVTRRTEPIAATVRFRSQRSIAGTTLDVWAETGSQGARLELVPGTYEVNVRPSEESGLPGRSYYGVEIKGELGRGGMQTVALPLVDINADERLVVVRGTLHLSYMKRDGEVPARLVRVKARTVDGQHTSSSAVTCPGSEEACEGAFELVLPAQKLSERREYQLLIEPTQEGQALPKMTLAGFSVSPEQLAAANVLTSDSVELVLEKQVAHGIPDFSPVHGVVVGRGELQPVAGAIVSARGTIGLAREIEFAATAASPTDAQGAFTLMLPTVVDLAHDLTVTVTVEQSSPYASGHFDRFSLSDAGLQLVLDRKRLLNGVVFARDTLVPAAKVNVMARPVGDGFAAGNQASTDTSADGAFVLRLEPGLHELIFRPPSQLLLPRLIQRVYVEGASEPSAKIFVLGRSSVVFGRVLLPDQEPAVGVGVEVFAVRDEGMRAVLIGSGSTDGAGIYRIIVPNPDDFLWPEG